MTHRRIERVFQLTAGGRSVAMAATVHLPAVPDPARPVLFLFPGAGYSRGYYDIRVEGFEGYSQAEHHAREGVIAVAVDHLGVGDSPFDGAGLTFALMAEAANGLVEAVRAELRAGTLSSDMGPVAEPVIVGIGQSMGGHAVAVTQALYAPFAAVAMLGTSFTQARVAVKPGRRWPPRNAELPVLLAAFREDSDVPACFHWPETPQALVEADMLPGSAAPWRSATIPECTIDLLTPGVGAQVAASVRAPVLLVYGQVDVTLDPPADVAAFRSTADICLLILPRMAHMHNFAPTRARLWRRLISFADTAAETVACDRK